MQAIERTNSELGCVLPRQIGAPLISKIGNSCRRPHLAASILCEAVMQTLRFLGKKSFSEYVLLNRMSPFCNVQRRDAYRGFRTQQGFRSAGMLVRQVKRDKKAGVCVNAQKRPRSSMTKSAPGKMRSPNISLRKAAKSGSEGFSAGLLCGTIRAITLSRSRSSTVFPERSQLLSLRVSLS